MGKTQSKSTTKQKRRASTAAAAAATPSTAPTPRSAVIAADDDASAIASVFDAFEAGWEDPDEPSSPTNAAASSLEQQQQQQQPDTKGKEPIRQAIRYLQESVRTVEGQVWLVILSPPGAGGKNFAKWLCTQANLHLVQRQKGIESAADRVGAALKQEWRQYGYSGRIAALSERALLHMRELEARRDPTSSPSKVRIVYGSSMGDGMALVKAAQECELLSADQSGLLTEYTNNLFWRFEKAAMPRNKTLYVYIQPKKECYEARLRKLALEAGDPQHRMRFYQAAQRAFDELFIRDVSDMRLYTLVLRLEQDHVESEQYCWKMFERIAERLLTLKQHSNENGWLKQGPDQRSGGGENLYHLRLQADAIQTIPPLAFQPQPQQRRSQRTVTIRPTNVDKD